MNWHYKLYDEYTVTENDNDVVKYRYAYYADDGYVITNYTDGDVEAASINMVIVNDLNIDPETLGVYTMSQEDFEDLNNFLSMPNKPSMRMMSLDDEIDEGIDELSDDNIYKNKHLILADSKYSLLNKNINFPTVLITKDNHEVFYSRNVSSGKNITIRNITNNTLFSEIETTELSNEAKQYAISLGDKYVEQEHKWLSIGGILTTDNMFHPNETLSDTEKTDGIYVKAFKMNAGDKIKVYFENCIYKETDMQFPSLNYVQLAYCQGENYTEPTGLGSIGLDGSSTKTIVKTLTANAQVEPYTYDFTAPYSGTLYVSGRLYGGTINNRVNPKTYTPGVDWHGQGDIIKVYIKKNIYNQLTEFVANNPYLVDLINKWKYCIHSLIGTGYTSLIRSNGNNYLKTDIMINNFYDNFSYELSYDDGFPWSYDGISSGPSGHLFGTRNIKDNGYSNTYTIYFERYTYRYGIRNYNIGQQIVYNDTTNNQYFSENPNNQSLYPGRKCVLAIKNNNFYINGLFSICGCQCDQWNGINSWPGAAWTSDNDRLTNNNRNNLYNPSYIKNIIYPLYLFTVNNGGYEPTSPGASIAFEHFYIGNNPDSWNHKLIPYCDNGVYGMVDLVTRKFYPGSTIAGYDDQPLEWILKDCFTGEAVNGSVYNTFLNKKAIDYINKYNARLKVLCYINEHPDVTKWINKCPQIIHSLVDTGYALIHYNYQKGYNSSRGSYSYLDYHANNNTKIIYKHRAITDGWNSGVLGNFSYNNYSTNYGFGMQCFGSYKRIQFYYGKQRYVLNNVDSLATWGTIEIDKNKCYVNGELQNTFTEESFQLDNTYNFGLNTGAEGTNNSRTSSCVEFINVKIYNNNTLIYDIIPFINVKDITNNTYYSTYLDLVNNKLYRISNVEYAYSCVINKTTDEIVEEYNTNP